MATGFDNFGKKGVKTRTILPTAEELTSGGGKSNVQKVITAPGIKQGLGAIGGVLDILNRPAAGVMSGAAAVGPNSGRTGNKLIEYVKGVGRGLSGKEHLSLTQAAEGKYYSDIKHDKGDTITDIVGGIVFDPTTWLTAGTGAAAKTGLKAAEEAGAIGARELGTVAAKSAGKELRDTVAKRGVSALNAEQKKALRQELIRTTRRGNPEKRADKILKALDQDANAGIKFHVPGTDITHNLVKGSDLSAASRAIGLTKASEFAKGSTAGRLVDGWFHGDAALRRKLGSVGTQAYEESRARDVVSTGLREKWTQQAQAALDVAGKLPDEEKRLLQRMFDKGGSRELAQGNTRLQGLYDNLDNLRKEIETTKAEASSGTQNTLFDAAGGTTQDLHRMLTPEGEAALKNAPDVAQRAGFKMDNQALTKGKISLQNVMPDQSVQEINAAIEPELRAAGVLKEGQNLFHEGAITPILAEAENAADAVAELKYLEKLQNLTDNSGQALLSRSRRPGDLEIDLGPQGTFFAPPEVKATLDRTRAVITNNEEMSKLRDGYLKWERAWKGSATLLPVGGSFFARNARGNFFLNYLAGVNNPRTYTQALGIQKKIASVARKKENQAAIAAGRIDELLEDALGTDEFELLQAMKERGVIDTTQAINDLGYKSRRATVGKQGVGAAIGRQFSPEGTALKAGGKLNSFVEVNARMAHFISKANELGDYDEAAKSVKKYLFDYGDLSPVEQHYFKRVVPFYTFMRKNVPVQVETFIKNPSRFTMRQHVVEGLTDAPDSDSTPRYLQDGRMVPPALAALLGRPASALITTPDNPLASAVDNLSPVTGTIGLIPGVKNVLPEGLRPESAREVARDTYNTAGGPVKSLADYLIAIGTGVDPFTGNRVKKGDKEAALRALKAITPATGKTQSLLKDKDRVGLLKATTGLRLTDLNK